MAIIKQVMVNANIVILKIMKIIISLKVNAFIAIFRKIMKFQFMVNANVKEILFYKIHNVFLSAIFKIVSNPKEEYADYVMNHNFA